MSIYNCHRQQPQPWMSYISPKKIVYPGECCPALVTGNRCNVDSVEIIYGYLYNWYAATDVRNIAADGWHVPTITEYFALRNYVNVGDGGYACRELGTTYWDNSSGTNIFGLNARGTGIRNDTTGVFFLLKRYMGWWSSDNWFDNPAIGSFFSITYNIADTQVAGNPIRCGISIRLAKDSTILSNGETGTYIGNDGKVYRTICIGTQEWLADNLAETLYRNGDPIPEVTDNGAWAVLVTGARCSYDNDESYALSETTICGQALLPFQVISNGAYMKMEYSLYGEDSWSEITLPVTTVMTDGFFIHSYNGEALASELPCGVYEFRLTAGETWYFEPIMIEDFDITTNEFSKVDELMTPFKFTEQIIDTTPLIAPCDRILPFMFRTDNVTSGSIVVTMVDSDGAETSLSITVQTGVIDGKTYYWHRGECLYPFLTCGKYYLKIVDGANTYYSVPFMPECGISDIPDGSEPLRDANGCVMRDDDGTILYEPC